MEESYRVNTVITCPHLDVEVFFTRLSLESSNELRPPFSLPHQQRRMQCETPRPIIHHKATERRKDLTEEDKDWKRNNYFDYVGDNTSANAIAA